MTPGTGAWAPPFRASIIPSVLNRTRQAKSPNALFGPEESAITLSNGASKEGVASNVAVKVPVWFVNGVLTQTLMAGVVMHAAGETSGTTLKLHTVLVPVVISTIAPQLFRFVVVP